MILETGMTVSLQELRKRRTKLSVAERIDAAPNIPESLKAQWKSQLEEDEARIRARNPLASDEQIEGVIDEIPFECLIVQRRYLQGALKTAERIVQASGFFPSHNDYASTIERIYVGMAAMS